MSDKIINLSQEAYDSAISGSSTPLLVDFWAPWCGPCKAIAPILEDLANELGDAVQIAKVNVDDNQELAGKLNIRAIPTLLLYKNGAVVETMQGMSSKADLKAKIEAHS